MEYSQDPGVEAQAETTANNNAMGEITVELLYYQRCGGCMHVGGPGTKPQLSIQTGYAWSETTTNTNDNKDGEVNEDDDNGNDGGDDGDNGYDGDDIGRDGDDDDNGTDGDDDDSGNDGDDELVSSWKDVSR